MFFKRKKKTFISLGIGDLNSDEVITNEKKKEDLKDFENINDSGETAKVDEIKKDGNIHVQDKINGSPIPSGGEEKSDMVKEMAVNQDILVEENADEKEKIEEVKDQQTEVEKAIETDKNAIEEKEKLTKSPTGEESPGDVLLSAEKTNGRGMNKDSKSNGKDNISAEPFEISEGADELYFSCPYCFMDIPTTSKKCEYCGGIITETILAKQIVKSEGKEKEDKYLSGETGKSEDTIIKSDTKKLSEKPVPSVLKETTLFLPAKLKPLNKAAQELTGEVILKIGKTTIGRVSENDISFPDEDFISRHHCEINYHKYQYVMKDLNSANGTYINEVKIQETVLRSGDIIQLGSLKFEFEDPVEEMKKKKAEE